jgi:hypothetical protein
MKHVIAMSALLASIALVGPEVGCAQLDAVTESSEKAVGVVVADLEAGKSPDQIIADVTGVLGGSLKEATAAEFVYNVISSLLSSGLLSSEMTTKATAAQGAMATKMAHK